MIYLGSLLLLVTLVQHNEASKYIFVK